MQLKPSKQDTITNDAKPILRRIFGLSPEEIPRIDHSQFERVVDRDQRELLLEAANTIRKLRDMSDYVAISVRERSGLTIEDINDLIERCSLAAIAPGGVEYSKPEVSEPAFRSGQVIVRLPAQADQLDAFTGLARALGCMSGAFTIADLTKIAEDTRSATYADHSIALNKIHALLHRLPEPTEPMPAGASAVAADVLARVAILVEALDRVTNVLVLARAGAKL